MPYEHVHLLPRMLPWHARLFLFLPQGMGPQEMGDVLQTEHGQLRGRARNSIVCLAFRSFPFPCSLPEKGYRCSCPAWFTGRKNLPKVSTHNCTLSHTDISHTEELLVPRYLQSTHQPLKSHQTELLATVYPCLTHVFLLSDAQRWYPQATHNPPLLPFQNNTGC